MTDVTSNVTPLRRSRKAVRQRNAERQCRYRQPKAGKVLDAELPSTSPPVAPPPVAIRNAARNAAAITTPENNHVSPLMLPEGVSDRDYEPAPNPVSNYAHSHVSDCPRRCRCRIATSRQDPPTLSSNVLPSLQGSNDTMMSYPVGSRRSPTCIRTARRRIATQ
jgi:hypothetical protein